MESVRSGSVGEAGDQARVAAATDRRLLQAWKTAEAIGEVEAVLAALRALVDWRLQVRDAGTTTTSRDLYLVALLVTKLLARGRPAQALQYCLVGREASGASPHWTCFFAVKGAMSCVQLLDFASSQRILENLLQLGPGELLRDPDEATRRALTLAPVGVVDTDRLQLRADALFALARWLAAQGRLAPADNALARLVEMLERCREPPLPLVEVVVMLAELRFDRGRFAAVEALLDDLLRKDGGAVGSTKASILQSQILHAQGRFTQGLAVLTAAADGASASMRQQIALQRVHLLASLNRLTEAEDILDATEPSDGSHLLRMLLRERRASTAEAVAAPSPRQMFALSEETLVELDTEPAVAELEDGPLQRSCERLHVDIAHGLNSVLLAAHEGNGDAALAIAARLQDWAAGVDSCLLLAKVRYAWALAAYAAGDVGTAERAGTEAASAFGRLGMLPAAWAAQRVVGWCLERRGALPSTIRACRLRLAELQREIGRHQAAIDAATMRLNKWSTVDEEIAVLCDDLAVGRSRDGREPTPESVLSRILSLRRADAFEGQSQVGYTPTRSDAAELFEVMLEATRRRHERSGRRDVVHRLASAWMPDDVAVLHLLVLPDRVAVFASTSGGCTHISPRRRTAKPELWQLVRKAQTALGRQRWQGDGKALRSLAEAIGFDQIRDALPSRIGRLMIIPDDVLGHAPFAALPVGGEPLIMRWEISILPAFGWRSGLGRSARKARRGLGVAVEVAPRYANHYPPLRQCLAEIQAARDETSARWQLVHAEAATRASVLARLSRAQLAHFACHGDFFGDAPRESGLLLHDEWLRVADIETMRLEALRLVVLAACWGANAARLPGAVQIGLPFAFLRAGADHVIASLWRVGDEAAVELTRRFYRDLRHHDPVTALAMAQRASIDMPPSQWAGHVIFSRGVTPNLRARIWLQGARWLGL
jgi:CHAT domain-containing protein